jgi:hypothetical protein
MKKIIVITLACILAISSFLFTACDKRVDNNKQSEQTKNVETTAPAKPIPVPSANGKNAKQLFVDAMNDYTDSKSFDISMTMETTEKGVKTTQKIEIKLSDTSMYMDMLFDETDMTLWLVDNVIYVEMDGTKIKATDTTVADVLGEDFYDEIMAELPTSISEIPEAYMKKLEEAQIYSFKGMYYVSVTVTDAEAVEMELDEKGYTETLYFDSKGAIKKIVSESEDATLTILMNSYGKDIEISKPENADEFIEKPVEEEAGPGSQDPTTYAVYEDLIDRIDNATSYSMNIEMNGEPYISYRIDSNGGKYVYAVESEDSIYEIWAVNGQGYVSKNLQYPQKATISSDILQSFDMAESLKDYFSENQIHGNAMTALNLSNTEIFGEKILTFNVNTTIGIDAYSFTFGDTYIDVLITSSSNGQSETIKYIFDFNSYEITAPI